MTAIACPPGYSPNPGHCPPEAQGKRVLVILATGQPGKCDGGATVPPGWAADGKGGCRWTITGDQNDIAFYRLT